MNEGDLRGIIVTVSVGCELTAQGYKEVLAVPALVPGVRIATPHLNQD